MTKYAEHLPYNMLMESIYIDLHFLLNLLLDYLICLVSARVCGLRLKRLRYLWAAMLGAGYSVVIWLPGLEYAAHGFFQLVCAFAMGFIAFGSERSPIRCTAVFLGISALFGGAVRALGGGVRLEMLLVSFAVCYGALSLFFRSYASLPDKKRVKVAVELGEKRVEFMALVDTGNSLSDPVTGSDVMIACPHALMDLFENEPWITELQPTELIELSALLPELRGRFRLVPYSAVGSRGMLAAFRPDGLWVEGEKKPGLLVALSAAAAGDGFEAVI